MSQIFGQAIGIHGQRSLLGFQVRTNWKLCLISDLLLVLKFKLNPILLSQISLNSLVRHLGIKSSGCRVSKLKKRIIMLCSFSLMLKIYFIEGCDSLAPFTNLSNDKVPEQQMQRYLQNATI